MDRNEKTLRVAFVYPPYGPEDLPSLGLALFSASLKQRGFSCRSFYWNLRFTHALPGTTFKERKHLYRMLALPYLSPWNEWVFMRHVAAESLSQKDPDVLRRLFRVDYELAGSTLAIRPSDLILGLSHNVGSILRSMSDELSAFDVVGISTTFSQNAAALALAQHTKQRWPEKKVVLGGANCDGEMGRALLEKFDFLDFVFSGEVDHSFPEFVERLEAGSPIEDIPGIAYRDELGRVHAGPMVAPLQDLNVLPFPDFDDYISERKRFGFYRDGELCLPLESSRGCWWGVKNHCTFCGLNGNGMAYRQKDPDRFQKEVEAVTERYRTRYLFMADNILSAKYFGSFVQWAKAKNIGVDLFYEIKANVNRKKMEDLASAGIRVVQPGIESFSTRLLSLMRKGIRGIHNVAFLRLAREMGIHSTWNILGGFPGEEPADYDWMARQIPKLVHLQPPYFVGSIEYHRFSPYHTNPASFGLQLRPHEKYSFIYPFDEGTIARIAYVFQADGRAAGDQPHLKRVEQLVNQWRRRYDEDRCTLTWKIEEGQVQIRDRRPGFAATDYLLEGHAAAAFCALDEPRKGNVMVCEALRIAEEGLGATAELHTLSCRAMSLSNGSSPPSGLSSAQRRVPERRIKFGELDFARDAILNLSPLVDAGILLEEDGVYLALPVPEGYRPMNRLPEILQSTLAGG